MNISSIQVTSGSEKVTRVWRCRIGAGRFRNAVVLTGNSSELQQVAKGIVFALTGRRSTDLEEVAIELADNSGDTWTIQRGPFGGRFMHNGRAISVDLAQKSMLAALLDMDVGIGNTEGLVAHLVYRIIESRRDMYISRDGLSKEELNPREIDAEVVNKMLAEECARLVEHPEYADPSKLAKIADTLITLQGRWSELQTSPNPTAAAQAHAPSISMIETLSKELDHLQQIDFLCKKMGDSQDNVLRLATQIEVLESRLSVISEKWSPAALSLGSDLERWGKGIELLVRARGYAKLAETASRIKKISTEKLRPIAEAALSSWDRFLGGSKVTGQELESCLASTLLGMKQLSSDLEKISESSSIEEPLTSNEPACGWFDRLRGGSQRSEVKAQADAAKTHQKWLARALGEIESVKASLDYSLKSVQSFVDASESSRTQANRGLVLLEELALKSSDELSRLSKEWSLWAEEATLSQDVSIEDLCVLACESAEFQNLMIQKVELTARYGERVGLQKQLEALIRQWWDMIGSDKNVDIKNPAFLVAEARAALRHRDTRRQRVHKIVKDAARHARDESLLQWSRKRKSEIQAIWNDVFQSANLPSLDISDSRVPAVARLGGAIQAMRQMQAIKEEARLAKSDLWGSDDQAAVRVYLFDKDSLQDQERGSFLDLAQSSPMNANASVQVFLVADQGLSEKLVAKGFGGSIMISHEGTMADTPMRSEPSQESKFRKQEQRGGAVKESKQDAPVKQSPPAPFSSPQQQRPALSAKAEAILKLLNPKSRD